VSSLPSDEPAVGCGAADKIERARTPCGRETPALRAALDRIAHEFGIAAFHRSRKRRVRRLLRPGCETETRLRYGWLADEALARRLDLAGALVILDLCHRANMRHGKSVRLWASSFRLLNRDMIFALRLTLRWLRRHAPSRFRDIIVAMAEESRIAAE
jgi:hypothetical protein